MLNHTWVVPRASALRRALVFNEQFPNDKRAGLIKASNYTAGREKNKRKGGGKKAEKEAKKKQKKKAKKGKKSPKKKKEERNLQVLTAL